MLLFMFKNAHISLHFIGYFWIYKQENDNSGSFGRKSHMKGYISCTN